MEIRDHVTFVKKCLPNTILNEIDFDHEIEIFAGMYVFTPTNVTAIISSSSTCFLFLLLFI